jgi:hypothetical protein
MQRCGRTGVIDEFATLSDKIVADEKVAPAGPNGDRNADRFVGQLYAELKPSR